ncbi:MAG: cytochrome c [Syntrophobacterales bacterium]|jgi:mono/diheme cytochrome c family protein
MKSIVTVVTVLCLLLMGIAASAWAQGDAAKGKALVDSKKCALCHKEGSKLGKPMEMLGGDNDAKIKGALTDPKKTLGPQVKMPAYKLTDAEVQDIIAYLRSIKK